MEEKTFNGYVYRRAAAGQPWQLVGPAQQKAPGGVVIGAPSAKQPYEGPTAAIDLAKKQQDAADAAATSKDRRRQEKAAADAAEAEAALKRTQLSAGGATPEQRAKAQSDARALNNLQNAINDMAAKYGQGPGGTKPNTLGSLMDFLPTNGNRAFNDAGNSARPLINSALGLTASQSNTEKESQRNQGAWIPNSWDTDEQIVAKLKRLQRLVNDGRATVQGQLGDTAPSGLAQPSQVLQSIIGGPITQAPPPTGANGIGGQPIVPAGDQGQPGSAFETAKGATRTERDTRTSSLIDQMIRAGASAEEINAQLPPGATPVNPALIQQWQRYLRSNPNYKGSTADATFETANSLMNRVSSSPLAAGVVSAADAMVPMRLLAGDQGAMATEALQRENPTASLIGTIAGGVPAAMLPEMGAARILGQGSRWAPRIGDAAYGAWQGYGNADEGQGLEGALTGAVAGTVGGAAGRNVIRGTGNVLTGAGNEAVQYLRQRGIPTTIGQTLGGLPKQLEDAMTSAPIIGGFVQRRRGEGLDAFERTAFNDASAPLANQTNPINATTMDTGALGIEQLRALRAQGYGNAVNGRVANTDPQFGQDYASSITAANQIPNTGPGLADEINAVVPGYISNGALTGENAQAAISELRGLRTSQEGGLVSRKQGAVRGAEDAITGLFNRQVPGFAGDLAAANQVNTNLKVLEDAVKAAKNVDERFMPSQLNAASVKSATNFGNRGATTQRPFYDLAMAGQEVLPSKMADSGTAYRAAILGSLGIGGLAGGAGQDNLLDTATGAGTGGLATTAGLGSLLALIGTRGGQRAVTSLLADRPDILRRIGGQINDRATPIGGVIGAPLASYYLSGP